MKALTPFRRMQLQIALARRGRNRVLRRLCAAPRPAVFRAPWGFAVIHGDTRRPGCWRATWLDHEREPMGHVELDTYRRALEIAAEYGADLNAEVTPGRPCPPRSPS